MTILVDLGRALMLGFAAVYALGGLLTLSLVGWLGLLDRRDAGES